MGSSNTFRPQRSSAAKLLRITEQLPCDLIFRPRAGSLQETDDCDCRNSVLTARLGNEAGLHGGCRLYFSKSKAAKPLKGR